MRQISTGNGGMVVFDASDWKAGLGPGGRFAATSGLKATENGFQNISSVDPSVMYGSIAPGWNPSAAATGASNLAGTIIGFETKDNTIAYGVDTGGKVHSIDYSSNTISGSAHTITGTTPIGQDCLVYKRRATSTTYTTSFFYSYYNTTNWNVGCIPDVTSFASFDDTFMSGTVSPGMDVSSASPADGKSVEQRTMPHPMCIGSDDILYIGSGRYLHAYDGDSGAQGTFTSRVLTLPAGTQIVGIRKYNNLLLIAVNYYSTGTVTGVGQALLYTWNYTDADVSDVTPLEDNYVSALFMWKGSPTVVTSGILERNGNIKVKVISGNSVTKIADFDGTLPLMRGIVVANEVIYMNCGGKIITIGDRFTKSRAVNHIGTLGSPGNSGGLFFDASAISSIFLLGSSGASTTYSFNSITSGNGSGAGNCRTFSFFPQFPVGKTGKLKTVYIEYAEPLAASGTNGTFQCVVYTDSASTTNIIANGVASVTLPLMKRAVLTTTGAQLPQFSSFEVYLAWVASTTGGRNTPIISQVAVEFDIVNLAV